MGNFKFNRLYHEVNFDGLVGPTHHFGGYAFGNLPSMEHRKMVSHPKKAALQGLNKMKRLADLGVKQAVLPPRMRPSLSTLRALGFRGTDPEIFHKAAQEAPLLLYMLSSSSSMWAANSGTVAPSVDTADGRLHITVANLSSQFHRSIEAEETWKLFRFLFPNERRFMIHPPLPKAANFGDEGAANHTRLCQNYGSIGIHLFVYGKTLFEQRKSYFPLRQTKEASAAVARLHGLNPLTTLFAEQNPEVIEAGAIHNDVISVGNRNLFLYHEKAFINTDEVISQLNALCPLKTICVTEKILPLSEAIRTYFFNSQIVTLPKGEDLMLLPEGCMDLNLNWLPIKKDFIDVQESLFNGGGPACLRLRCVMNEAEIEATHQPIFLTPKLYMTLKEWIEKHYRDRLSWEDLQDPLLFHEIVTALDSLTQILNLGNFYS